MIEIKNITKRYSDFMLCALSFTLCDGEITAIIGKNGAGKSTLIKILEGLVKPSSGKILVNGEEVTRISDILNVGYLSQDLDIYSEIRMRDLIRFVSDNYKGVWDEKLFKNLFYERFHLNSEKKIKDLSTGMRVKFFLAMELAKKPTILLLDEPTSGVDPMMRDEVLDILLELAREESITIFLSSHITEDIEKIGDRVIFIDNGHILLNMEKQAVKQMYRQLNDSEYQMVLSANEHNKDFCVRKTHEYYICERKYVNENIGREPLLSDVLAFLQED